MATRRHISLALVAALTGALTGCAASGFGWGGSKPAVTATAIGSQPAQTTLAGSVASGLKNTTDKVSAALTIKPKVTPAEDPIALTGREEPVGADVYLSVARLHETRGDVDTAAAQYQKALEASPKNLAVIMGYARLRDRQGKFDEATKLYRKAIAAHPQSAKPHNDLGLCQARNGDIAAALESLMRAVQLEPNNKLYRNNTATVLVDMGRSKEAFEQLAQVHSEAIAHYNLGYLLYQLDKLEPASQQFALAVEKDPSLTQAQDMLQRSSGVANRETVRKTQHIAEAAASRPEVMQRQAPQAPPAAFAPRMGNAGSTDEVSPRPFPPMRLPEVTSQAEDEGQLSPLGYEDAARRSGNGLRSFPRVEANE